MGSVQHSYGVAAQQYIELFDDLASVHRDDLAFIEDHLGSNAGQVLDAGCGPGHLTAHLCGLGVQVSGIDITPEFVAHARTAHPGVQFDLGSIHEIEAPDGSFGGVLAWYSLIHMAPDALDLALIEVRRATEPGGTLVTGFFTASEIVQFDHKVTPAYYWPVDDLAERLARAGFVELDRCARPADPATGTRAHGAIAAVASDLGLPRTGPS